MPKIPKYNPDDPYYDPRAADTGNTQAPDAGVVKNGSSVANSGRTDDTSAATGDPYATSGKYFSSDSRDPNDRERNAGFAPNYGDKAFSYDPDTQYHPGLMGGTREANNLYRPDQYSFGNISSDRYMVGASQAAGRGNDPLQAQQNAYIQMLQQQAAGNGPSAAQGQLRAATDANVASAMGMAASQRGAGASGAGYQAANMASQSNQQAANQSAIIRAQEQQSAQQMLGGALGQARGQNVQEQGQRDDLVKFYMGQGATADQANRQAAIDLEKLRAQQSIAQDTADNNAYYGKPQTNGTDFLSKVTSAVGSMAGGMA